MLCSPLARHSWRQFNGVAACGSLMRTLPLIDELEAPSPPAATPAGSKYSPASPNLFVGGASRYSDDQVGVFDDVMRRGSSPRVEAKARAKLSHRLAPIANAPSNVISMLASTTTSKSAAGTHAVRTDRRADLLAYASSKSQQHLHAISQRRSLSEAVTDVLVERGDRDVGPFGGEELRRAVLRRRLSHAGQALERG